MNRDFKPMVSIIIPAYNASNYLEQAIESALNQTYDNIEVLVINDGSNDNNATESIALSYGNRIRYFRKDNGGVSSALNLGINYMKGVYFSWLSHDDVYYPQRIERHVQELSKIRDKRKVISLDRTEFVDADLNNIKRLERGFEIGLNAPRTALKKFIKGSNVNGCGLLIPRQAFDEVGVFSEKYRYIQDADMWYKLFLNGYSLLYINEKLVMNRIHKKQVTNTRKDLYFKEKEDITYRLYEKTKLDFDLLKELLYDAEKKGVKSASLFLREKLDKKGKLNCFVLLKCNMLRLYSVIKPIVRRIYYTMIGVERR